MNAESRPQGPAPDWPLEDGKAESPTSATADHDLEALIINFPPERHVSSWCSGCGGCWDYSKVFGGHATWCPTCRIPRATIELRAKVDGREAWLDLCDLADMLAAMVGEPS